MCLALVALNMTPGIPLLMIGNRDEYHGRPTEAAHWWGESPNLFAGRDKEARGTWFGISKTGQFGLVTNFREHPPEGNFESRGQLLSRFLTGNERAARYVESVSAGDEEFAGFNLISGTIGESCLYASNRATPFSRELASGIYAVSNALLDTPWPKLVRVRDAIDDWFRAGTGEIEDLFQPLMDREVSESPDTEFDFLDPRTLQALTAPFIVGDAYGTRSTTIAIVRADRNADVIERRFGPDGKSIGETRESFEILT